MNALSLVISSLYLGALLFFGLPAVANPYFDPTAVPKDSPLLQTKLPPLSNPKIFVDREEKGLDLIRVQVAISKDDETYRIASVAKESSGTPALMRRARQLPKWGSYRARLRDEATGKALAHDSIGTGKEFRKLVDQLAFRFPLVTSPVAFELDAENPETGIMETVLRHVFDPRAAAEKPYLPADLEIREMKRPTAPGEAIRVNIYAEGYSPGRKSAFWEHAEKAVAALVQNDFPRVDRMHFYAVFASSTERLGRPQDLGTPVPERNSFLGLYFPYWNDFGRWYHVLYPTREERYRKALAVAPYDYAITLVDDSGYWGVGNFRELTAIPAESYSFTYLLLHELGHYFGLNEEYEGGGRTELEFAPGIEEPWSPNITFLKFPDRARLKWREHVAPTTQIPTPRYDWSSQPPVYGAYRGGYADSQGHSHKPGFGCVMESGSSFCQVCRSALAEIVGFDLGD